MLYRYLDAGNVQDERVSFTGIAYVVVGVLILVGWLQWLVTSMPGGDGGYGQVRETWTLAAQESMVVVEDGQAVVVPGDSVTLPGWVVMTPVGTVPGWVENGKTDVGVTPVFGLPEANCYEVSLPQFDENGYPNPNQYPDAMRCDREWEVVGTLAVLPSVTMELPPIPTPGG